MNDRVIGRGFQYECKIGFHDYERHIRQRIKIDFEAETDWRESAQKDRAKKIINYYEVNEAIRQLTRNKEWKLLEALAEDVAQIICMKFPVTGVRVRASKQPFDMPNAAEVAVECTRKPSDFGKDGA